MEEIGDGIMNGDESLNMFRGFEPLHDPFSPSGRLMRILGPIIETFVLAMIRLQSHVRAGGSVGSQFIGDQNARSFDLFADELAQQAFRRTPVTAALYQGVKNEAILIDGAPEPMRLAIDGHDKLIEMPLVSEFCRALLDGVGKIPAKLLCPAPDSFVADHDPTDCEHVLDHSQAEREAKIQPHGMRDDLGGKPMTGVQAIAQLFHTFRLSSKVKRGVNVTVPARLKP